MLLAQHPESWARCFQGSWREILSAGRGDAFLALSYCSPFCSLHRSMLPDVIDDFKLQHPDSHGHEAIFFSFYVFFTKFTSGVSLGISTLSLE